jgi:hypothetical protein
VGKYFEVDPGCGARPAEDGFRGRQGWTAEAEPGTAAAHSWSWSGGSVAVAVDQRARHGEASNKIGIENLGDKPKRATGATGNSGWLRSVKAVEPGHLQF